MCILWCAPTVGCIMYFGPYSPLAVLHHTITSLRKGSQNYLTLILEHLVDTFNMVSYITQSAHGITTFNIKLGRSMGFANRCFLCYRWIHLLTKTPLHGCIPNRISIAAWVFDIWEVPDQLSAFRMASYHQAICRPLIMDQATPSHNAHDSR